MMDMINNSEKLCRISITYCSISKQSVNETAGSMWYWLHKTMRIFDKLKTIDIHSQTTTLAISLSQKVLSPSCNQSKPQSYPSVWIIQSWWYLDITPGFSPTDPLATATHVDLHTHTDSENTVSEEPWNLLSLVFLASVDNNQQFSPKKQ